MLNKNIKHYISPSLIFNNLIEKMSFGKNPTEFSKLLKNKKDPEIIYQKTFIKSMTKHNNFFSFFLKKIKENPILILLIVLTILSLIFVIFIIIISLNSSDDILYDKDKEPQKEEPIHFHKINVTNLYNETKMCTENNNFVMLKRINCFTCGLFSYYIVHLGCIITFLNEGYIPIIETNSFPNVFNGYKTILNKNENPWEMLFNQPCGYTLNDVKENKKNIKYLECPCTENMPNEQYIYSNKTLINYYHNIAKKYMSVKKNIIDEANIIWKKLFNNSKNVLGVLVRGTDYITRKPFGHPIPPTAENAIKDIKKWDKINNYDFIFLTTEDNIIRNKFIKEFKDKVKYLLPNKNIEYDYNDREYLTLNPNVAGNMEFEKIYVLSIVILSKCIVIISSRTSGAAGAFILSEGFRNDLVYYLGDYY